MNTDRYSRQQALVPARRLEGRRVTVIGVGAVGRQVALQLASIGVGHLQLIDHDKVEESNISSQGYREDDLGHHKVNCAAEACGDINYKLAIEIFNTKFNPDIEHGETIFCCVDSMDVRKEIFEAVKDTCMFFIDGRMSAETMRILTAYNEKTMAYYPTTLFPDSEAFQESCTAKTTIYCANVIAGIMVGHFAKSLRDVPIESDIQYNLLANELTIIEGYGNERTQTL